MSIAVQPYHRSLRDALFAFHARCFPERDTDRYRRVWRWQYFENPLEPDDAERIWVVTVGNDVVAHLGTMAADVELNGEVVRGRWSSDLMVDERYRNGGLGVLLIREWLRSCDVTLAKGLSAEAAGVYRRLGWHNVPLRRVAQLPLTLRAVTGRATRNRLVNATAEQTTRWAARAWAAMQRPRAPGIEYRTVDMFPGETDAVMERSAASRPGAQSRRPAVPGQAAGSSASLRYSGRGTPVSVAGRQSSVVHSSAPSAGPPAVAILRNRAFLQWRYVNCPVRRHMIETARRDGRLSGFAVLSVRQERGFRRGIIHDLEMEADGEGLLRGFIAHCVRRMHEHRADEVAFLPRSEVEQRAVASLGFLSRSRPEMMMYDVRCPQRDPSARATDCNVQLGDGDDW